MNKEENRAFIEKTESFVNPQDVTAISFLGDFNKFLPKKIQHTIMKKGSSTIPYMGFIVEPYCFFLSYKIQDIEAAQSMLPEQYELAEASLFRDDSPAPLIIFSAFSARTSAFMGVRLEMYIIARNKETGLLSWIISDYVTNTNSHDPGHGFCGYNSDPTIFTTTPYGELLVHIQSKSSAKVFSVRADLENKEFEDLDETLWIEGNLSVDYGGELKESSSETFSLIFDPQLMSKALRIPGDSFRIKSNTFFRRIIDCDNPLSAAVFPYSQHFVIRQDLKKQEIQNTTDLYIQIQRFLKGDGFKKMSGKDIKKPLLKGIILSSLINLSLIVFLLIKVFS
jgi:hypothetical protein